jgi:hypothetical protein
MDLDSAQGCVRRRGGASEDSNIEETKTEAEGEFDGREYDERH